MRFWDSDFENYNRFFILDKTLNESDKNDQMYSTSGVPLRSLLSPLLFKFFIDDFGNGLSFGFSVSAFSGNDLDVIFEEGWHVLTSSLWTPQILESTANFRFLCVFFHISNS